MTNAFQLPFVAVAHIAYDYIDWAYDYHRDGDTEGADKRIRLSNELLEVCDPDHGSIPAMYNFGAWRLRALVDDPHGVAADESADLPF